MGYFTDFNKQKNVRYCFSRDWKRYLTLKKISCSVSLLVRCYMLFFICKYNSVLYDSYVMLQGPEPHHFRLRPDSPVYYLRHFRKRCRRCFLPFCKCLLYSAFP